MIVTFAWRRLAQSSAILSDRWWRSNLAHVVTAARRWRRVWYRVAIAPSVDVPFARGSAFVSSPVDDDRRERLC